MGQLKKEAWISQDKGPVACETRGFISHQSTVRGSNKVVSNRVRMLRVSAPSSSWALIITLLQLSIGDLQLSIGDAKLLTKLSLRISYQHYYHFRSNAAFHFALTTAHRMATEDSCPPPPPLPPPPPRPRPPPPPTEPGSERRKTAAQRDTARPSLEAATTPVISSRRALAGDISRISTLTAEELSQS